MDDVADVRLCVFGDAEEIEGMEGEREVVDLDAGGGGGGRYGGCGCWNVY